MTNSAMTVNSIILGNCRDILSGMPDNSIDCIITSPPYDNLREYNKSSVWNYGERFNVWDIPPCNSSNERCGHVAPFPVKLAADHIRTWTNEGDIVLDPFAGSGTTAIAAIQLNRRFICIEIDHQYHKIASDRIAQEQHNLFNIICK